MVETRRVYIFYFQGGAEMTELRQPRRPDGALRQYTPYSPRPSQEGGQVVCKQIILLTKQHVIAENMSVEQLIDYINLVSTTTQRIFQDCAVSCEMLAEITFTSSTSPAIALFSDGSVPAELVFKLYEETGSIPPAYTRQAPVHIQIIFGIGGEHSGSASRESDALL
jgi:hypothetical protein